MRKALSAEVRKATSLPSVWLASALAVGLPIGLAALNARMLAQALDTGRTEGLLSTATVDEGFGQLAFGVVGAVILGVVLISSEYTRNAQTAGGERQVTTTMVASPRRFRLMAAKLSVLVAWVALLAVIATPLTLWASATVLGRYATALGPDVGVRCLGAGLFWVVMALLSFGFATVTRSGIVPLVLFLTNSSMVSFSLLLAPVTDATKFLPDIAAYSVFLTESPVAHPLSPMAGLSVLCAWGAAACGLSFGTFLATDA